MHLSLYAAEEKERLLEDALSDWLNTVSELHRKTASLEWVAKKLRDRQMVDSIFGLPFDKAAFLESNKREFQVELHSSLARTSFDLLRTASHCKDHTFHQEQEWRLALPHKKGKTMKGGEVLYRGTNDAIPYIAHNLFAKTLPVVRVKIGPLCENAAHIKGFLERHGYNVPVERSGASLRASDEPGEASRQPRFSSKRVS